MPDTADLSNKASTPHVMSQSTAQCEGVHCCFEYSTQIPVDCFPVSALDTNFGCCPAHSDYADRVMTPLLHDGAKQAAGKGKEQSLAQEMYLYDCQIFSIAPHRRVERLL